MERSVEASNLRQVWRETTQGVDGGQCRRVVERRQLVQLVELGSDRGIDHGGTGEPCSSVDDPVTNGVERSDRGEEATQVILQRSAWRVEVDGLGHAIVTFDDTELETRRSRVHDEYPHSTVLADLERVGSVPSSPVPKEFA